MVVHCQCGREMKKDFGNHTFNILGESIELDNLSYAKCECECVVFSSEVAEEIENRLIEKYKTIKSLSEYDLKESMEFRNRSINE